MDSKGVRKAKEAEAWQESYVRYTTGGFKRSAEYSMMNVHIKHIFLT